MSSSSNNNANPASSSSGNSNVNSSSNQFSQGINQNAIRPNNMNTPYYGSRGMGGMGMGMGMGIPFGGYNNVNNPFMASLQFLNSLNYIVYTVGHMTDMLGMNANAILQGYHGLASMLQKIIEIIKKSDMRLWLRKKSKKSKLLRFLFVFLSMTLTAMAYKIIRLAYIYLQSEQVQQYLANASAL